MFHKIMIPNRGEIAIRIIRTCKEMGISTVVVYSDVDAESLHVKLADEAYHIGPADAAQSYLNTEKLLEVAMRSKAEALHPGYGFLAENPEFAEMCEKHGIVFIGPTSECMYKVKPKHRARQLMRMLNIPVVPGSDEPFTGSSKAKIAEVEQAAESIGYPVIIKPSGGGGGIGMVVAGNRAELGEAVRFVEERGRKAFGVPSFYVEKRLTGVKHIEVQVLADKHGNVIHLGERDCSVQRRFQKLIEEAPCQILSPHLRMKMYVAALDVAVALQYINALTVEFFYVPDTQEFYFNEVNSRLQVEHCVTELAFNVDIVKEQIRIAAGERLSYNQDEVVLTAPSINCRITGEDASRNFFPCPGKITSLRLPHGLGVRIDEGVYEGYELPPDYDSLLLKLMVRGQTREEAILRMQRALSEMKIEGIETIILFHQVALDDETFKAGKHTTDFIEKRDIIKKVQERAKIMRRLGSR
ncbi:MAG: ATP-grasp domain-containing protein [Dehalococcoidia bacterium]|nr:ATP-grasp domain-containing protein [Dehalococcoidia bacterium]